MVDYAYPPNMPHDFELYSNQEPQMDYMSHPQAFVPSNGYMDPMAFPTTYDSMPMTTMAEAPRPQDLQFHYDGIAQGVKPSMHYSPAGSPNSGHHSYDTQPPHLSASSESGASVSSSAMGSPSLNPQYDASWNAMNGLGLTPGIVQGTSGYEYDGLVVTDKHSGCVDPNLVQPFSNVFPQSPYATEIQATPSPYFPVVEHPPSPALSHISSQSRSKPFKRGSQSPYLHTQGFQPYPHFNTSRRRSDASIHSDRKSVV